MLNDQPIKVKLNQKRHIVPELETHLLPIAGIRLDPQKVPDEKRASLITGEIGKVHFLPSYSAAEEFRPGMRLAQGRKEYSETEVNRGKKFLKRPDPQDSPTRREGVKYFPEEALRRGVPVYGLCVEWKALRKFDTSGIKPKEYDMEGYMNRKKRIATIEEKRNGIPIAVEGDRAFKLADREPGFYAKGGIIPGSTIQLRKSAKEGLKRKPNPDTSARVSKNEGKTETITYAEKVKRQEEYYEAQQVLSLSIPSQKMGQVVPSFEERTGNFLVRPEDEKD